MLAGSAASSSSDPRCPPMRASLIPAILPASSATLAFTAPAPAAFPAPRRSARPASAAAVAGRPGTPTKRTASYFRRRGSPGRTAPCRRVRPQPRLGRLPGPGLVIVYPAAACSGRGPVPCPGNHEPSLGGASRCASSASSALRRRPAPGAVIHPAPGSRLRARTWSPPLSPGNLPAVKPRRGPRPRCTLMTRVPA